MRMFSTVTMNPEEGDQGIHFPLKKQNAFDRSDFQLLISKSQPSIIQNPEVSMINEWWSEEK